MNYDDSQAVQDFKMGGVFSRLKIGYQERPSQIDMVRVVVECIREGRSAVIEAPTGTGKSFAYLDPIVHEASKAEKVTVISTSNKALQAQIFDKDIPFIQTNVHDFKAALLKGMNNFLCLERLEEFKQEWPMLIDADFQRLEIELRNKSGDFEKLSRQHDVQLKINGHTDECIGKDCSQYADCFYYKMKEAAKNASVIVTNHTILLMDIALGGRLLPAYDVLVIDESHNLEKEAQEVFSAKITVGRFLSLANNQLVKDVTNPSDLDEVKAETSELFENVSDLFSHSPKDKITLSNAFLESIEETSSNLAGLIKGLSYAFDEEVKNLTGLFIDDEDFESTLKSLGKATREKAAKYRKLHDRALKLARDVRDVCTIESNEYAYYASRKKNKQGKDVFELACTPLNVSQILGERLFNGGKIIICTSATITSANSKSIDTFNSFTDRVGMEPDISKALPSVFDYQKNALFYFPTDIAQPIWNKEESQIRYEKEIAARMQQLVEYSGGRAFLLFTSNKMMNAVHRQLRVPYPVLKQGDLPKSEMIRRFKQEPSVLLGVASFWEGVDIAGEALSLLVIDKLPFEPPDDPIGQGTVNLIKQRMGNEWEEYIIPRVIIKLKQGVGRLIRTNTDRGVVAILDERLYKKRYGKQIRASLPPAPITSDINNVANFFGIEVEQEWDEAIGW